MAHGAELIERAGETLDWRQVESARSPLEHPLPPASVTQAVRALLARDEAPDRFKGYPMGTVDGANQGFEVGCHCGP